MDKREAATVLQNAILEDLVLAWPDCKRLESGIQRGLEEIARRRQDAGPEVMEMVRPRCCNTRGPKAIPTQMYRRMCTAGTNIAGVP